MSQPSGRGRRLHLVVAGRVRPCDFMDGARVRIRDAGEAFERLGVETTRLDADALVGPPGFARAFGACGLWRVLLGPRRRLIQACESRATAERAAARRLALGSGAAVVRP